MDKQIDKCLFRPGLRFGILLPVAGDAYTKTRIRLDA